MMDRTHAENALAARLERDDLQNHGQCLADENKAHNGQKCLRMREDRHSRKCSAECERSRISHEDTRRMMIIPQKTYTCTNYCRRKDHQAMICAVHEHGIEDRRCGDRAGGKPVESIRQIDRVRRTDENEYDENVVEHSDVPHLSEDRHPYARIVSEQAAPDQDGDQGDNNLPQQLLIGAQTEVALFDHLDVVVRKAEQKMPEKDEECEQCRYRERRKEKCRERHGEHNHHAAHRRCPAFFLMARRALLPDALPVFQTMQKREEIDAAEEHDRKCRHKRQEQEQPR